MHSCSVIRTTPFPDAQPFPEISGQGRIRPPDHATIGSAIFVNQRWARRNRASVKVFANGTHLDLAAPPATVARLALERLDEIGQFNAHN